MGSGAARQYKLADSDITSAYPHQFSGWSFASKGPFDAAIAKTLIRVPLRTAEQASRSQISQVCHVINMFQFLICQSVLAIQVYVFVARSLNSSSDGP